MQKRLMIFICLAMCIVFVGCKANKSIADVSSDNVSQTDVPQNDISASSFSEDK